MANTLSAVDWAIGRGANGVEIDIDFNSTTGDLRRIHHGTPCDCTCKCLVPPFSEICGLDTDTVCAPLYYDVKGDPCEAETPARSMFNHIASKNEIALVYLDSKIKNMDKSTMEKAGVNVVKAVNQDLFGANYGGKAIIGILRFSALPYLEAVIGEANKSSFKDRIYFTIENEENQITKVLETLHTLPIANIVYGTGSSSCNPVYPINDTTLQLAAINKVRGVTGMSYSWTVDKTSRMLLHMQYLQGIMTNYPGKLYDLLLANGNEQATQASMIPVSTSKAVITSTNGYSCDCEHRKSGCVITKAAPKGMACKCEQKLGEKCEGTVVNCHDTVNAECQNPDISLYSCLQGSGNCGGYTSETCTCSFESGGCVIKKAPLPNTACKCEHTGPLKCTGIAANCIDKDSQFCKLPDTSIHTCMEGRGNCNGYTSSKCECDFKSGGCLIRKASSTNNTACKCTVTTPFTCKGEVVKCLNTTSMYCQFPDDSYHSCFQGNGNCAGYTSTSCECKYTKGGCIISKPAPHNAACRCVYNIIGTCRGELSRCCDPSNKLCLNPDISKSSCLLGGGNCGGYK